MIEPQLRMHPSSDPTTPLPGVLPPEDWQRVIVDWNRTGTDLSTLQCLHRLVELQAEAHPHNIALESQPDRFTYAEFNRRANQLAHHLASCGVQPGARVCLCLDASPAFAIATLAILKLGAACVPLDPKYPADRLAYMAQDVEAQVVLTGPGAPSFHIGSARRFDLAGIRRQLSAYPQASPALDVSLDSAAYVIYTSGSTGKPRGVLLSHRGLSNYAIAASRFYAMNAQDRVLQFCSVSFDIALEEFFIAWASGAALVFRPHATVLSIPEFTDWITQREITVADLPTAYWHEWVSQFGELESPVPASLRLVIVGGEKARTNSLAAWQRAVGSRVRWVNTYGPTEASIAVTRFEPEPGAEIPANIPIGRPVENCRIYLLDDHFRPVPVGAAGELCIGGACVAQGYFQRPELTAEKFIFDPFSEDPQARVYRTGDLARYLPNGDLEYLGRSDDQVKIRGFRVELSEIEAVIAAHPSVREVAVVAIDDDHRGKSVVAHIIGFSRDEAALQKYATTTLPEYMVPSAFVYAEQLPTTPNGKLDRRALAAMPLPNIRQNISIEPPANDLEQQLLRLWEDALGLHPLGVLDNFFDLGGHSLLAARLMHRVGRIVGRTVPLAVLFEAPTVRQLATLLREGNWSRRTSSLVAVHPTGTRPAFFCVHGVGGNVLGFRELGRRMAPEFPFYGLQSQGLHGDERLLTTVEDMAAHYIREIRSVQPEGPFFLGGYSFGGLVAYEMAQQLRAGNEQVALLALFDTYPGDLEPVGISMLRLARKPARFSLLRDLPFIAHASIQRRLKGLFLSPVLKRVLQANQDAAARYQLRPYEGQTTLFRAEEFSLRSVSDPHAAWETLAVGGLEVHEIAGGHGDILMPPQVQALAAKLKSCVDACSSLSITSASEERALA